MIQNIAPSQMNIDYKTRQPQNDDPVIVLQGSELMVHKLQNNQIRFPRISEVRQRIAMNDDEFVYLFKVDEEHFYLYTGITTISSNATYSYMNKREMFHNYREYYGFVAYTACHINDWYTSNRYCGRCGEKMEVSNHERAMTCGTCKAVKYPQISPVVIVAVQHEDKILLTKYANSDYDRYALIAGFVEVGESFEDAVRREVMEEVGLKVKKIRYYGSQPWGISGGLLAGYFAELDGDSTVKLDLNELKEGTWMTREELPQLTENEKSLTHTMMYEWSVGR